MVCDGGMAWCVKGLCHEYIRGGGVTGSGEGLGRVWGVGMTGYGEGVGERSAYIYGVGIAILRLHAAWLHLAPA